MSGETEEQISGWTVDTYRVHNEAMRQAEEKAQRERERFHEERDRRYAEVATEREKAVKIKEAADLAALQLARDIQVYKDEKANQLREQIASERGLYPTRTELVAALERIDAAIKPLSDYVQGQHGRQEGIGLSANTLAIVLSIAIAALALYFGVR